MDEESRFRITPETAFDLLFLLVDVIGRYSKPFGLEKSAEQLTRILGVKLGRAPSDNVIVRDPVRRLGSENVHKLARAYEEGTPTTQLMSDFALSKSSVLAVLRHRGVSLRRQPASDHDIALAAKMYESGHPLATIAERLDLPTETVRRGLISRGTTMRGRGRPKGH